MDGFNPHYRYGHNGNGVGLPMYVSEGIPTKEFVDYKRSNEIGFGILDINLHKKEMGFIRHPPVPSKNPSIKMIFRIA